MTIPTVDLRQHIFDRSAPGEFHFCQGQGCCERCLDRHGLDRDALGYAAALELVDDAAEIDQQIVVAAVLHRIDEADAQGFPFRASYLAGLFQATDELMRTRPTAAKFAPDVP